MEKKWIEFDYSLRKRKRKKSRGNEKDLVRYRRHKKKQGSKWASVQFCPQMSILEPCVLGENKKERRTAFQSERQRKREKLKKKKV